MEIAKRRDFARWQRTEGLFDHDLCAAASELERGLVDASLGGMLFKKRIKRASAGKSSGFRTLIAMREGKRCIFLHGFAKNDQSNVSNVEKRALQMAGKAMLSMDAQSFAAAIEHGILIRVECDE